MLLADNRLEEAKAVKEKKELLEAEYILYPTWPFNVRAKLFSTVLGASGSLVLGILSALSLHSTSIIDYCVYVKDLQKRVEIR